MVGKDKGKQGNVAAFIRELNAVFVSGLNLVKNIFLYIEFQIFSFNH
jgi:ribosomal protein L24